MFTQVAREKLEIQASVVKSLRADLESKRQECDQLRHVVDQNHSFVQSQVIPSAHLPFCLAVCAQGF